MLAGMLAYDSACDDWGLVGKTPGGFGLCARREYAVAIDLIATVPGAIVTTATFCHGHRHP